MKLSKLIASTVLLTSVVLSLTGCGDDKALLDTSVPNVIKVGVVPGP